ncbi:MAG: hypothetical protein WBU92_05560 [Candidatus Dormiibacterota bacterium]
MGILGVLGFGGALAAPTVGAWTSTLGTMTYSATGTPSVANPGTASGNILAGQYAYDTATISMHQEGDYVLSGTMTFNLYPGGSAYNRACHQDGTLGSGLPTALLSASVPVASLKDTQGQTETLYSYQASVGSGSYQIPSGTSVGSTYFWVATYQYTEPGAHTPTTVVSDCNSEPVTVVTPPPAISTTPTPTAASEGQPLTDSAVVTNPVPRQGPKGAKSASIEFRLVRPNSENSCDPKYDLFESQDIPYDTSTGSVDFSVSGQYPVMDQTLNPPQLVSTWNPAWDTSPGTYRWVVDYTYRTPGPGNSVTVESGCNDELVTVNAPTIATTAYPTSAPVGHYFSDTATVTNVPYTLPSPKVTFRLYQGNSCTGTAIYTSAALPLIHGMAAVPWPGVKIETSGAYQWQATLAYGAGLTAVSACGSEQVSAAGTPTITTLPIPTTAVVGSALTDLATITGLYQPAAGDTVSFALYSDNSCHTLVANLGSSLLGTSVLVNGVPTWKVISPGTGYAPTLVGTYYWKVAFKAVSDPYNLSVTLPCGEPTVLTQTDPSISTTPSAGGPVGTKLSDTATITGLYSPLSGDLVDFALYSGTSTNGCPASGLVSDLGTVSLSGPTLVGGVPTWTAASPGTGFAPTTAGTYYWKVTFKSVSDPNNPTVIFCGEQVTITSTTSGGVLGASTTSVPGAGADLLGPGLLASLALLLGALSLTVGMRLRRRPVA